MIFGTAAFEDINELIKMRIAYIKDEHNGIAKDDEQTMLKNLPQYFSKHLGKDLIAFIAKENNEIIATAFLLITEKPSSPNFMNGLTGTVLNVFTLPLYRKKGIAANLMNSLIAYAKEHKFDFVELKATKEGYSLYKKIGFNEYCSEYTDMRLSL